MPQWGKCGRFDSSFVFYGISLLFQSVYSEYPRFLVKFLWAQHFLTSFKMVSMFFLSPNNLPQLKTVPLQDYEFLLKIFPIPPFNLLAKTFQSHKPTRRMSLNSFFPLIWNNFPETKIRNKRGKTIMKATH